MLLPLLAVLAVIAVLGLMIGHSLMHGGHPPTSPQDALRRYRLSRHAPD